MLILSMLLSFLTCGYVNIVVPGNPGVFKTFLLFLFIEGYATNFKIYWSYCGLFIILWWIYICLVSSTQSWDKKLLPEGMATPCFLHPQGKCHQDWAVDWIILISSWTGNSPLASACAGFCRVRTFQITDLHRELKEWKAEQYLKDAIQGTP